MANRHKKLVNRNLSYQNKGEQSHSFMKSSSMMGEGSFCTISNNRSLINKTALQKLGTLNGEEQQLAKNERKNRLTEISKLSSLTKTTHKTEQPARYLIDISLAELERRLPAEQVTHILYVLSQKGSTETTGAVRVRDSQPEFMGILELYFFESSRVQGEIVDFVGHE